MGKGQKSLTLPEDLHAKLIRSFERNHTKLRKRYGVSSFTSYAQLLIKKGLEKDQIESRFEIVNTFEDEIRVRDYLLAKDALVRIEPENGSPARLFCDLDGSANCPHVGFAVSDVAVIRAAMGQKARATKKISTSKLTRPD